MNVHKISTKAIAAGTTSAAAILAVSSPAVAQDVYLGFGAGLAMGSNPSVGYSSYPEDYKLGGMATSMFIGAQTDIGNDMFAGVEVAFTGPVNGDADDEGNGDYAYNVNYNVDGKLRVGKRMGNIDVYGFGGVSSGSVSKMYYTGEYDYWGFNAGIGAQMNIAGNMFIGAEYIHRFTDGYADVGDYSYKSDHGTLSLRAGVSF